MQTRQTAAQAAQQRPGRGSASFSAVEDWTLQYAMPAQPREFVFLRARLQVNDSALQANGDGVSPVIRFELRQNTPDVALYSLLAKR